MAIQLSQQNWVIVWYFIIFIVIMAELWLVFWWIKKHKYQVNIFEAIEGVFLKSTETYIVVDIKVYKKAANWKEGLFPKLDHIEKQFFKKFDFFKRGKQTYKYEDLKNYVMLCEGSFLQPLYEINMTKVGNTYSAWLPLTEDKEKDIIKNTAIVWIDQTRERLYEYTKQDTTNKDVLLKILLPLALIVLAMIMVIFFPKMYDAVSQGGHQAVSTAMSQWDTLLNKMIPAGGG